jgi:hypothetical protein
LFFPVFKELKIGEALHLLSAPRLKLKANHNLQQTIRQGQAIKCIGKQVGIDTKILAKHTVDAGEARGHSPPWNQRE